MSRFIRFVFFIAIFQIVVLNTTGQERIHIHTDKDLYLPGETIWFKAYIYRDNQLSIASTNFYIGLYDKNGKLLEKKHYPVFDGVCKGDLQLPDSLSFSLVQIRAFTKYIAVNDSTSIYLHAIPVYQKEKEFFNIQNIKDSLLLTVKAEGNVAVAGIPNYFFLKAVEAHGIPLNLEGIIIADPGNIIIDSVKIPPSGLAKVQITPKYGTTYKLKLLNDFCPHKEIILPMAQQEGIVLHTETKDNTLYYNIQKSIDSVLGDTVVLEILRGGELFYVATHNFKKQLQVTNKILLDSLDAGLYEVELKEKNGLLLQKKSIYVSASLPEIQSIETNYNPKGKNIIRISVPEVVYSNLSVSVYDANFHNSNYSSSIYNDLYNIKNKKQYFENSFANLKDSDFELLSNFATLNTYNYPLKNLDDKYLSLQLKTLAKGYNIIDEPITLIIKDRLIGNKFLSLLPVDNFKYQADDLIFFDTAKLYYQLTNSKNNTIIFNCIILDEFNIPENIKGITSTNQETKYSNNNENLKLFQLKKTTSFNSLQTIEAVTVKSRYQNPVTKRLQQLDDKYASGMFKGLARGYQLNVLDDPSADMQSSLINYIKYRIPQLNFLQNSSIFNQIKGQGDEGSFPVFINETESNFSILETLQMSEVAYIKYIPGIVIGSSFVSSGGALYIYTKKGDEPQALKETIVRKSVLIKGYDSSKDFLIVKYNTNAKVIVEDYRSTLYWNPNIFFDVSNKSIDIEYYNNDVSKKHILVLKGINEKGEVFEIQKVFQ